jgi:hypothetical protein
MLTDFSPDLHWFFTVAKNGRKYWLASLFTPDETK